MGQGGWGEGGEGYSHSSWRRQWTSRHSPSSAVLPPPPPPVLIAHQRVLAKAFFAKGGGGRRQKQKGGAHFWRAPTSLDPPPPGGRGVKPKRHPPTNHQNQHAPLKIGANCVIHQFGRALGDIPEELIRAKWQWQDCYGTGLLTEDQFVAWLPLVLGHLNPHTAGYCRNTFFH